jgi:DNA (cytosine-5)-methyltransferase 1
VVSVLYVVGRYCEESMSKPTVISTFAGPGGSSLGYERAGFDVRAALDCAPGKFSNAIIPTYKKNHPDTVHVSQDARETSADELLDAAGLSLGEVDVIDGSPPCSPFSSSNTVKAWGDHESGTLFDRYTYFIEKIQPRTFIAENVPGLALGKTKGYYKQLCQNLRDIGYNLTVQKIDAAYLGAAHHRNRLIFIGVREDIGAPPTIKPTSKPTTVREAFKGLEQSEQDIQNAKRRCERSINYEWFDKLPADAKTSIDEIRTDGSSSGITKYRLSWRKPSRTLTATRGELIHPDTTRFLTISEAKRLTGLPDDYEVPNWECVARCLPPILTETIGTKIIDNVL